MRSRFLPWRTVLVVALLICPALGAGVEGHRIIAQKYVELLPEELAPLFRQRLAELEERAVEPELVWPRDKQYNDRRQWHRVALDVEAETQTKDARLAAASRFPLVEAEAKRLYNKLNARGGDGTLPWVIEAHFNQLVTAFRDQPEDEIVRAAGYLVYFAAQAASPFNATVNHDGKLSGNLILSRVRLGHPHYAHRDVAARFDGELVRRCRARYADAITLGPGDYEPVDEPVTRARAVLLAALSVLDDVLQADAETIELMQVTDGDQLADRADEYYPLLDERCGGICVERLRHGAIFAANLVGGAWMAAGKPSLEQIRGRSQAILTAAESGGATSQPASSAAPAPTTAGPIVGSRHSNIYHYPACTYAKQIAPDNLVFFESSSAARAEGRRACRSCKPQ